MIALSSRQRSGLLFFSASAMIAWFSGVGERIDAEALRGAAPPVVAVRPLPTRQHLSTIILRDPFAGRPDDAQASAARAEEPTAAPRIASEPAVRAVAPDRGDVVVPNIDPNARLGAATAPDQASEATTLVLKATITGGDPVAYVAAGSAMQLVRVGDALEGRSVRSIDRRGLLFTDGARLELAAESSPGAPPPAQAPPAQRRVNLTLDQLRKLVAPGRSIPSVTPAAPSGTPAAAPDASYPSPGPIPTVNAAGVPVGQNPTPDAAARAPYPNPYFYDTGRR